MVNASADVATPAGVMVSAMFEIVGAHRMRMQLEAGDVRHPDESRCVPRHDLFGGPPGGKSKRHHLDPRRTRLRRTFLIEKLSFDPVRVAHEHVGPIAGGAKRAPGDRQVVAHEIQLREPCFGKEDFSWIGDGNLAALDTEELAFCSARHRASRTGRVR